MNTRRYPRTMQEAFGPYTSSKIEEPRSPLEVHEWALYVTAVLCLVVLAVFA